MTEKIDWNGLPNNPKQDASMSCDAEARSGWKYGNGPRNTRAGGLMLSRHLDIPRRGSSIFRTGNQSVQ